MSMIMKDERFEVIEKLKYTVTNWSTYNQPLQHRAAITFMIRHAVIANLYIDEPLQPVPYDKYSDT